MLPKSAKRLAALLWVDYNYVNSVSGKSSCMFIICGFPGISTSLSCVILDKQCVIGGRKLFEGLALSTMKPNLLNIS